MMKKTLKTILILLLIAGVALMAASCGTLALWRDQGDDTREKEADVTTFNPSAKYIVYAALNGAGSLVPSGGSGVAAYAVVGYTGTIEELEIPATYQDTSIHANALPVRKVMVVSSSYSAYRCSRNGAAYTGDEANLNNEQNSTILKSIVFGSNINYVGKGVCGALLNLEKISFTSSSAVILDECAFMYCPKLATVTGSYTDETGTAFTGCPYTPPTV